MRLTPIQGSRIALALRFAAPYIAVIVCWSIFHSAWLAILAYHAQIVFWLVWSPERVGPARFSRSAWLAVPSALAGPAVYLALPYVTRTDPSFWLASHGLTGGPLVAMVFYFGLVHPPLEQLHWAPLRARTPVAHLLFGGYHVLVLYSLLPLPWLVASFVVLAAASYMWREFQTRTGSLVVPILSHVLADLGIVVAAYFLT